MEMKACEVKLKSTNKRTITHKHQLPTIAQKIMCQPNSNRPSIIISTSQYGSATKLTQVCEALVLSSHYSEQLHKLKNHFCAIQEVLSHNI